jgi:SLOG family YspA-like protein
VRLLVTGSRSWSHTESVNATLAFYTRLAAADSGRLVVVHGSAADGADTLASGWVARWRRRGWPADQEPHPANWRGPCGPKCVPGHRRLRKDGTEWCPYAGHDRNTAMVASGPDVCVAFWRGSSPGTRDCATKAEKAGIPTRRITWDERELVTDEWLTLHAPRPDPQMELF